MSVYFKLQKPIHLSGGGSGGGSGISFGSSEARLFSPLSIEMFEALLLVLTGCMVQWYKVHMVVECRPKEKSENMW